MSATTQNAKDDPIGQWPTVTNQQTIGGTDIDISTIFSCGICNRIYCNAAGTVAVKRTGDTAFVTYTVVAGTVLIGKFTAIGSTSHGSTAIVVNLELVSN